jgi:amidase
MSSLNLKDISLKLNDLSLTSEALVTYYLNRMKAHDVHYNSIAYINSQALNEAKRLDLLRQQGVILSPLHGVPILIKDNIDVTDMPNTANAFVMKDHIPKEDAPLIQTLKDAGMIILGKTNLSEWAYFMSDLKMPSGYGSLHGQVKHPYRDDIDPLGSSTGSAVSVALDFAPLSIGTETNGSLMAPAYVCNIVSLKPTFNTISNKGIIPISPSQDTAGPMGRTVYDVALLFDVLTNQETHKTLGKLKKPYHIGILTSNTLPVSDETSALYASYITMMESLGHKVTYHEILDYKPASNTKTLCYEMKSSLNDYLKSHDIPHLKSLEDIVKLNELHKERTLKYSQTLLTKSLETTNLEDPEFIALKDALHKKASIFKDILRDHHYDALVSAYWLPETPISGLPSVVVPAKPIIDAKPISFVFIGSKHSESTLLDIAYQYELYTQKRKDPMLK